LVIAAAVDLEGRVQFIEANADGTDPMRGRFSVEGKVESSSSQKLNLDGGIFVNPGEGYNRIVGNVVDSSGNQWIACVRAKGEPGQARIEISRVNDLPKSANVTVAAWPENFSYSSLGEVDMIADGDGVVAILVDDARVVRIARVRGDGLLDPGFGEAGVTKVTLPTKEAGWRPKLIAWPKERLTAFVPLGYSVRGTALIRVGR
jgi:hypothetical protein